MARLETQINQIYYLPDDKRVALILTEETFGSNSHLFFIADLVRIAKRTEKSDLEKISEIILGIFRDNKKLSGEALFESSLAEINQRLADFAHAGKKTWLGKFSAALVLKHGENICLANTGQMSAMLYRNDAFLEVLPAEKLGLHPLKIFSNFTTGKLKASDVLLLTTSNLFNYLALSNLAGMLSSAAPDQVAQDAAGILKDTAAADEGFASFFITMSKAQAPAGVVVPKEEKEKPKPAIVAPEPEPLPSKEQASPVIPLAEEEIYAPLPGSTKPSPRFSPPSLPKISFGKLKKFHLPKISFRFPKLSFWEHLSTWAKFFLVSFIIFLLLFASNIIAYSIRKHRQDNTSQAQAAVDALTKDLSDAESSLIYRDQTSALNLLAKTNNDLNALKDLDPDAYNQYQPQVADLSSRINHITVVSSPQVLVTLKHPATNIARAGAGFYIADSSTGTISTYNTSSTDKSGKELFLLNQIGQIQGLVFIPNVGGVVITASEMYVVDTAQSQFDLLHIYPKTSLDGLRFVNPDQLYTLDKAAGQADQIQFSKSEQIDPVPLLKSKIDLTDIVDIGADSDIYLLSPTDLAKYTKGALNSNFQLQQPTDKLTSANKLFVAGNIYILESAKKRLLIYNKQGQLQTQIFFPNATDLRDFYVDESSRNIFLLDSDKIESITF
ncbi:MAG TPA: hypothetical protein VFX17_04095 [Patescibacteria group bacterium]|nr:hypothetical protein [Patescibacteria group bacterium]